MEHNRNRQRNVTLKFSKKGTDRLFIEYIKYDIAQPSQTTIKPIGLQLGGCLNFLFSRLTPECSSPLPQESSEEKKRGKPDECGKHTLIKLEIGGLKSANNHWM